VEKQPVRECHRQLPRSGPEREALREKGQFWTPEWVAEAMVTYVLAGRCDEIFDPAVGEAAFFRAAKAVGKELGREIRLLGTEIDQQVLVNAKKGDLTDGDLASVWITDFVLQPPKGPFKAIVANPPYIRHHRLPASYKGRLRTLGAQLVGSPLDGRAGIHVYFLLRALELLAPDGRLAFIMPADTCEGVFAAALWDWISRHYRLDAVVTFAPHASPFPGVDTNPVVFMIGRANPADSFWWIRCNKPGTDAFKRLLRSDFRASGGEDLSVHLRSLSEALATGLSRPPLRQERSPLTLVHFAKVMRGIATGANEFFFLTVNQASDLGIPDEFLVPGIGRTRDVCGDELTPAGLRELDARGRPTLLFAPDGRRLDRFPDAVKKYLEKGEAMGLPGRSLIRTRRPWYKMERRAAPPLLFAYLGRRNARFIRNSAGAVPLTGFLCVYPHQDTPAFVNALWEVLRHPRTVSNLSLVAKSYGSGAIKAEPRALEKLPIPEAVALEAGLRAPCSFEQMRLLPDA
jgi:hypothetical protein